MNKTTTVMAVLSGTLAFAALSTVAIAGHDGLQPGQSVASASHLSDTDAENVVRRSLQYVALYDTLLNFTFNKKNPFASGDWNKTHYPAGLMGA